MKPASIAVALLLCTTSLLAMASLAAENPLAGEPVFDLQKPFFQSQKRQGHWLTSITVAKDGSVLVFEDRREKGLIVVHRSEDGGKSWAKPVTVGELVEIEGDTFDDGRYDDMHHGRSILGNVVVDEITGDVMVFTTSMKPAQILYRSKDHGKTWKREAIVIKPDANGWLTCTMASSEPGITLRYGEKKGRLLMPCRVFVGYLNKGENRKYFTAHYSNALYSDDRGRTWHPSAPFPETGTGESGLVELSDGRIYYNSRTHTRPGNRRIAWSEDGGESWGEAYESKALPDGPPDVYGCKAGLVRLPVDGKDILVYSSPKDHTASEDHLKSRDGIAIRVSFDGARTWPVKRVVTGGPGGYTWLAAGRPGTPSEGSIYMLSAGAAFNLSSLARFNLAWAARVIDVGKQKQLFVDDHVVAEKHNVTREAGQATKYGVVMEPTLPSDFQAGVVHDGPDGGPGYEFGESAFCWFFSPHWDPARKMFRLWYMAGKRPGSGLAYAESEDGIHWTKPLISKDGKSNLVNWGAPLPVRRGNEKRDLLDMGLDGVSVTIDPTLPYGSPEKYKVAFFPNGGAAETRLGYSADGIDWSFYNEGLPVTGRAADFSNQIFWDPIKERYLLLCRQDYAAGGGVGELRGVRIMEHEKAGDVRNHPAAWKTLTTFVLEDPDTDVVPGTNIPRRQIHTMPLWFHEGVYFALTDVLVATNRPVPEGKQDFRTRHEKGVWEFYMAPSRDAVHFDFAAAAYPRRTLIPRGPDGAFDKDCVRPPMNIITHDDEHWIYYLGTNERWGARKWDARLGLAKLRLDGFFYLEAKEQPGTVVTRPFQLEGDALEVNVDATGGFVKAELLDGTGQPLPGFSGDAARTYRGYNELRLEPKWKGQPSLSPLEGKQVRLRFTMANAKLYAFQIR